MTRFRRLFIFVTIVCGALSMLQLYTYEVRWLPALVLGSLLMGAAFGGAFAGLAKLLCPERPNGRRAAALILATLGAGLVMGPLLLTFVPEMGLIPLGEWSALAPQPRKRAIAFLGEKWVKAHWMDKPRLYVLTSDGTTYSLPPGGGEWKEERAADSPTTRLEAWSFGLRVPPLFRRTLSRQVFTDVRADGGFVHYLAIDAEGAIWQCDFGYSALEFEEHLIRTTVIAPLIGLLSSVMWLLEREVSHDKKASGAT